MDCLLKLLTRLQKEHPQNGRFQTAFYCFKPPPFHPPWPTDHFRLIYEVIAPFSMKLRVFEVPKTLISQSTHYHCFIQHYHIIFLYHPTNQAYPTPSCLSGDFPLFSYFISATSNLRFRWNYSYFKIKKTLQSPLFPLFNPRSS